MNHLIRHVLHIHTFELFKKKASTKITENTGDSKHQASLGENSPLISKICVYFKE